MKKRIDRIEITSLKDPNIVKTLSYKQLEALCYDIRREIVLKTSIYGGHLSSNLGVVELTVALYRSFNFPTDKLIFDVGHQCYTHKILTGRSLDHLNEKGFVTGFENRKESNYDVYEAGHSSTSLSAIEGFAIARDLSCQNYNVVGVIGDASLVNGLAFEALNDIGCRDHKVIIVINDNGMSISAPTGAIGKMFRKVSVNRLYNDIKRSFHKSMVYNSGRGKRIRSIWRFIKSKIKSVLVPNTLFDNMGYTYIGPVDGHNIKALEKAFKEAKTTTKSAVVHVRTKKGKGYEPAENDKVGYWHGVTPFDIATGRPSRNYDGLNSWSHHMGDLIHHEMATHQKCELIVPAMVRGSGLEACFDDFPMRSIDVGIAEEHALTMAGAISLEGIHPIVTIYSTFLQRAYDEVLHDCARMNTDLSLLIDRAGLVGLNGATHQGIYDEAFLNSIPNVTLSMPSTYQIAKKLLSESLKDGNGVYAIRYPHSVMNSEQENWHDETLSIEEKKWLIRKEIIDGGVNVITVGPLGFDLFQKCKDLPVGFIDAIFLNPLDSLAISKLMSSAQVIIYDPYGTKNGFVTLLEAALLEKGYKGKISAFSVPNVFVEHASFDEQLSPYGLSLEKMRQFLEKETNFSNR